MPGFICLLNIQSRNGTFRVAGGSKPYRQSLRREYFGQYESCRLRTSSAKFVLSK